MEGSHPKEPHIQEPPSRLLFPGPFLLSLRFTNIISSAGSCGQQVGNKLGRLLSVPQFSKSREVEADLKAHSKSGINLVSEDYGTASSAGGSEARLQHFWLGCKMLNVHRGRGPS